MKRTITTSFLVCSILSALAQYGDYSIRVEVNGNGYAHYTEVYFEDGLNPPQSIPTYGWDGCCDALFQIGNVWQPQVFTKVVAPPEPPSNPRISINGLPHVFEHTPVPLGFLPGDLAQFTFTFKELYRIPSGITVELEDLAQNVTQDLMLDSTYVTWGATSDAPDRFIIHLNPDNVTSIGSTTEFGENIKAITKHESVQIIGLEGFHGSELRFFDMFGRLIIQRAITRDTETISSWELGIAKGIYTVELTSAKGSRKTFKVSL